MLSDLLDNEVNTCIAVIKAWVDGFLDICSTRSLTCTSSAIEIVCHGERLLRVAEEDYRQHVTSAKSARLCFLLCAMKHSPLFKMSGAAHLRLYTSCLHVFKL